jgi:anti-anti-sigma regulatory factor
VVLDLRELEFMDCAGAHLLVDSDHSVGKARRDKASSS